MMKKAVFIIPYFGEFKSYFQLFLNSCAYNKDFNWLIITDNTRKFNYPDNVRLIHMNFKKLQELIQSKFKFSVCIDRPYKLCDYKPTYGYLFSKYITGYKMWGYCDTDLIFGRISRFIKDKDIENYEKIGIFGHFTLIRNSKKYNRAFMLPLNGKEVYKDVLADHDTHSFDEEFNNSINNIFEQYNFKIKSNLKLANIYTKSSNFKLTSLANNRHAYNIEKVKKAFFVYKKGRLLRYSIDTDGYSVREYMYLHMQSRKMKVQEKINYNYFKIIPNSFDNVEYLEINTSNIDKIRIKHFNLHYFKLRSHNLYLKTKKAVKHLWKKSLY